jgi:hypothetical protein
VILAAMALSRGDAARPFSELDPVRPFDHAPAAEFWPSYPRACEPAGEGWTIGSGIVPLHREPSWRGTDVAMYGPCASRSRARVRPEERSSRGRKNYEAFFSLWKDADPDVPALRQARAEYAQLQ